MVVVNGTTATAFCAVFYDELDRPTLSSALSHTSQRTYQPWQPRYFIRFIAEKVCTASSRTNNKVVPLTNLNQNVYNGKSVTEVNVKNSSGKA